MCWTQRWGGWSSEEKKQQGPRGETENHLHPASSWMLPKHYLHWLVVFPQESTGKPESEPPPLPPHLSLRITLSVSLLLLLSQGQRWALTSQGQVFAYKESAFLLYMSFPSFPPQLMIHERDISARLKAIGPKPTAAQCVRLDCD